MAMASPFVKPVVTADEGGSELGEVCARHEPMHPLVVAAAPRFCSSRPHCQVMNPRQILVSKAMQLLGASGGPGEGDVAVKLLGKVRTAPPLSRAHVCHQHRADSNAAVTQAWAGDSPDTALHDTLTILPCCGAGVRVSVGAYVHLSRLLPAPGSCVSSRWRSRPGAWAAPLLCARGSTDAVAIASGVVERCHRTRLVHRRLSACTTRRFGTTLAMSERCATSRLLFSSKATTKPRLRCGIR